MYIIFIYMYQCQLPIVTSQSTKTKSIPISLITIDNCPTSANLSICGLCTFTVFTFHLKNPERYYRKGGGG